VKFRAVLFSVLATSAAVAAGCGGSSSSSSSPATASPAADTSPAAGGGGAAPATLNVAYDQDLTTGDPAMTGSPGDMNLLINVFDPLVQRDNAGKLQPSLATSWKLVKPTTWEFKLRSDVKFSDGEPFDAAAVKYSIERIIKNDKSPIQEIRSVKSVRVVDPTTVDMVTTSPDPLIPDKLALFAGMMVPPKYIEQHGESYFANHPVGTGPYTVSSWKRGSSFDLQANPDYWGTKPQVKAVDVRFITDSTTRVSSLLNHEVDLATAVPPTAAKQVQNTSGLALDASVGLRIYYVNISAKSGPLANPAVRQALSYATDTQALISKIMLSYATPIAGPLATTNFGHDAPIKPYTYDLAKAKALLAKAGFPKGFTVEFDTQPDIYQTLAQAVSQMWAQVGVKTKIKVLSPTGFDDKYSNGELPGAWNNGYTMWQGDPTTLIDTFFHSDRPREKYTTPALTKQIDSLQSDTDATSRQQTMFSVLGDLHENAPWLYLFQAKDLYGRSSDIKWTVPNMQLLRFNSVTG
jgi:peptide/nickel transport system substrate-binding protein